MNTKTIQKTKWFWAWDDEKEEAWLRHMAQEGFHLEKPSYFGRYTFAQGEKEDVVYRLDFVLSSQNKEDYFQLFLDAGWEHVGEMSGWQYWRKPVPSGSTAAEIYTDNESKIQKYWRVLGFMAIFVPILAINVMNLSDETGNIVYQAAFYLSVILLLIYVYVLTNIFLRIRALR